MINWRQTPRIEHIKGDTWCIVTGYVRIPFFKLDARHIVMMDSGLMNPDREGIFKALDEAGLRVHSILTSHTHIDHTGNHKALKERYDCEVYMTPFDAAVASSPLCMKTYMYGSSYRSVLQYSREMFCKTDHFILPEQKKINIEDFNFKVLNLPGHGPEHLGFVTPDNVAYLGDLLISEDVMDSIRIPYVTSIELDLESKKNITLFNYDYYILAHNSVETDIKELSEHNIESLLEKAKSITSLASDWCSLENIVASGIKTFGVDGDTIYKIVVSERNIRAFVDDLVDTGELITRIKDGVIEFINTEYI